MRPTAPDLAAEQLSEAECLTLLEQHSVGRIAFLVDGRPQILPVNYSMNGRIIALRTGMGTLLAHAPDTPVAFEIDGHDAAAGSGWSVVVEGTARDATDSNDDVSWAARGSSPVPLAPGVKRFWLAIEPDKVTGRRFGRHA